MKKFENEISINTSLKRVRDVLLSVKNLKEWDPEIASVEYKEDRIVSLVRRGPAINSTEYIVISELNNESSIIYKSFGGVVEYSVSFNLSSLNENTTLIHQEVELTKISNKIFQLDKLVLIAKDAFYGNLERLKDFCESNNNNNNTIFKEDSFKEFDSTKREKIEKIDKHFFENNIKIKASKETVLNLLLNVKRILEWDHDIESVKNDGDGFLLIRKSPSINEYEHLKIKKINDNVEYISTKGQVEYKIIFSLNEYNEELNLKEEVILTGYPDFPVPFSFFKPITKNAFKQVLQVLKSVAEIEELKK